MDYSILKNFKNFGKKVSVRPILMTATFATEKERVLLFGHRKADTRKVSGEKNSGFSFLKKHWSSSHYHIKTVKRQGKKFL